MPYKSNLHDYYDPYTLMKAVDERIPVSAGETWEDRFHIFLKIRNLEKYLWAIKTDNYNAERHYLRRLYTGIRYDNYNAELTDRLRRIFSQRAEYYSLVIYQLVLQKEEIMRDNRFSREERICEVIDLDSYESPLHENQIYPEIRRLSYDSKTVFYLYRSEGYASKEALDRYEETTYRTRKSIMEEKAQAILDELGYKYTMQKHFDDLKGDADIFDLILLSKRTINFC